MSDSPRETWLALDEAATRIGVSRLRMREAIAAGLFVARKDNRGFWQVLLGPGLGDVKASMRGMAVAPEVLVDLLFDEIEEIGLLLADRDATLERLSALATRQQDMIARALACAEANNPAAPAIDQARLTALSDRSARLIEAALEKLMTRDAEVSRLTGLLDRALATIGGLEDEHRRQAQVAERQKGLLERLFALANASLDRLSKAEPRGGGLFERLRERLVGSRPWADDR